MNKPDPGRTPGPDEDFQIVNHQHRAPSSALQAATPGLQDSKTRRVQAIALNDHIAVLGGRHLL